MVTARKTSVPTYLEFTSDGRLHTVHLELLTPQFVEAQRLVTEKCNHFEIGFFPFDCFLIEVASFLSEFTFFLSA
jgi:hypothetical protein